MATHAVVVGIDTYENPTWNLTSAVADATRFLDWALDLGGVDPANVTLLLSPTPVTQTKVQSRPAVYQAIQDAIDAFALGPVLPDDRLFVYFACHGISAPNVGLGGGPVVIPSDVSDLVRHRKKLYGLDEMIDSLASHGPREQFFFVDACRDLVLEDAMQAPAVAGAWRPKDGVAPCKQYALYATSVGSRAYGAYGVGVFSDVLLAALKAEGPKLGFDDAGVNFQVQWAETSDYVIQEVRSRIANAPTAGLVQEPQPYSRVGSGTAVLRSLSPDVIGRRTLSVGVQPESARKKCQVVVSQTIPGSEITKHTSTPSLPLPIDVTDLLPGTYVVSVSGLAFEPAKTPVKLWGNEAHVDITMKASRPITNNEGLEDLPAVKHDPGRGTLEIDSGDRAEREVIVRDLADTIVCRARNRFTVEHLQAGTYRVQVLSVGGTPIEETIRVEANKTVSWRYRGAPLAVAPAVEGMLGAHGLYSSSDNYVDPSEIIGPIPDQTLASLLALAVASQVFRAGGDLQKLRSFGVRIPDFAPAPTIVVLVASSDGVPLDGIEIGVMEPAGLQPLLLSSLINFPAGVQAVNSVPPGVHDVRIKFPDGAIAHHAVAALPDRISALVVVTGRSPEVQQYILPAAANERNADPRYQIERFMTAERMQRRFAANQVDSFSDSEVQTLLDAKWVDPLFGAIGGYSLLRRGNANWNNVARDNMLHHFGGLPDSHVLAGLTTPAGEAHFHQALTIGVPVVAEGVRALVAWARRRHVPLPPLLSDAYRSLVPGSPWTSWTSPRPRIELTSNGLGAIPPGWDDLADHEAAIAALVPHLGPPFVAVTPGTRIAVISLHDRLIAPGVVLNVDSTGFAHDCAPIGDGFVIAIERHAVVGIHDAANPTHARR